MLKVNLNTFPKVMKNESNKIDVQYQSSDKIQGYVYDGADGSQMVYWECGIGGISKEHVHEYDEYMTVVQGRYVVIINDEKYEIEHGKEIFIPKNTPHSGEYIKNTRTIHWFGGKRAYRKNENQGIG